MSNRRPLPVLDESAQRRAWSDPYPATAQACSSPARERAPHGDAFFCRRHCRYAIPGLNGCALLAADDGTFTLEEIAQIFAVSKERVRQVEQEALPRLRRELARAGIDLDAFERPPSRMEKAMHASSSREPRAPRVRLTPELAARLVARGFGRSALLWLFGEQARDLVPPMTHEEKRAAFSPGGHFARRHRREPK